MGLLRTALMGINGKLSELGATSDSFDGNPRKAVRTWGYFGQLYRKSGGKLSELKATSDSFDGNPTKAV
ncbi:hypothetical protein AB5I83_03995 [Mesobacillus sp. LC4]